jgi:addiction module RelE/StbE family toxin
MVQINWTLQAKDDLKSIAEFIARDSVRYAKLQVVKIKARTGVLKSHPQAGKVVIEINDQKIRELIEGNYRIIYKIISKNRVDILTILHSARDLTKKEII